jgi:hypothetical protein
MIHIRVTPVHHWDVDMQLHVHSQIAHVAGTVTDGKWRAPDSLGYNEHAGACDGLDRLERQGSISFTELFWTTNASTP